MTVNFAILFTKCKAPGFNTEIRMDDIGLYVVNTFTPDVTQPHRNLQKTDRLINVFDLGNIITEAVNEFCEIIKERDDV